MAPRANWKGVLKVAELTSQISLFTAASTSERIAFHTLNRKTGHRVQRQFIDAETGKPVAPDDQVKGYETGHGEYVMLEADEIAAAIPESDKTIDVQAFISRDEVDDVFFDRPYYLAPSNQATEEAFALLREGMRANKVAALARAMLFRRMRSLLIRPSGAGLIASTLNFDYEVRSADEAFADVHDVKIEGEMLDLAKHIIKTKTGKFDVSKFDDRYEAAVASLVKAKLEGRKIEPPKPVAATNVTSLLDALRESAKGAAKATAKSTSKANEAKARAPRKKAG